jgi:cytochrome c oxidase subunit 3
LAEAVLDPAAQERSLIYTSRVTVTVILGTVTMTFGALIAVFFYRSAGPKFWGPLQIPHLLWITTLLLLLSSWTFERAYHRLLKHDQTGFHRWMRWTFALAVLFLIGQVASWFLLLHGGLVLAKNPHSWFIFLFTGLHGAHILGGLIGIGYLLWRTREPASGPRYQLYTRVIARGVSVCWHYLDFLWIVLFTLLLVWRR